MLEQVLAIFGEKAFDPPVFYGHEPALRFELAGGDLRLDMFLQAIDRARAICTRAIWGSTDVTVILQVYETHEAHEKTLHELTHSLTNLGLPIPQWGEAVTRPQDELTQVLMPFQLQVKHLPALLWGIFAAELGINPCLAPCRVFIADLNQQILLHPYDDRGMDVIGLNNTVLNELYHEFNAWLLDYDRERMSQFFT